MCTECSLQTGAALGGATAVGAGGQAGVPHGPGRQNAGEGGD
jgi:hypothetical protein